MTQTTIKSVNAPQVATEQELAAWIAQGDAEWLKKETERKQREREALRAFNFEHAKFNLKRAIYANAIGE